jgi:predicted DNA-binding transcriptional regulator AlpA
MKRLVTAQTEPKPKRFISSAAARQRLGDLTPRQFALVKQRPGFPRGIKTGRTANSPVVYVEAEIDQFQEQMIRESAELAAAASAAAQAAAARSAITRAKRKQAAQQAEQAPHQQPAV